MKLQHILLPACTIAATAFLLIPTETRAFTTIGGTLNLSQRDYRLFNNFTDATANANMTPDSNFPGYFGAAMAIWKADLEWGNRHGDGNGDPTQSGGLGSGGANFDPVWQGLATGVGGINDNICSELAGSSGAVLAFTETPIADGWRMRFYSTWNWFDTPSGGINPGAGNNFDIQGIACHEFGHSLGLGHTTVAGSTMEAGAAAPGVTQRSIASDDILGVQSLYGVASVNKPVITALTTSPCSFTITGTHFAASGNEVWFTQLGSAGNGDPVMALPSAESATSITVTAPITAGSGDVHVHVPGAAGSTLSNGWPLDLAAGALSPQNYCFTSPNSFDPNGALMSWAGSTRVSDNNFLLIASGVPPNANGLFYYGHNQTFAGFGNGFRCIGSPVFRLPITAANLFGETTFQLDFGALPGGGQIVGGDVWNFQLWYRNPAGGGAGFNLTDGLQVPFCP